MYNYHDIKDGFSGLAFETSRPLPSENLNELQSILSDKITQYIKDSGASGVFSELDYTISSNGVLTFNKSVIAYVSGERFCIPKGMAFKLPELNDNQTAIMFLETWIEVADEHTELTEYGGEGLAPLKNCIRPSYLTADIDVHNRLVKKWRLRAEVADFSKTFEHNSNSRFPYLGFNDSSDFSNFYAKGAHRTTPRPQSTTGVEIFSPIDSDENLWIAGDEDSNFGTFDGFVLAIPMLRLTASVASGVISYNASQEGTSGGLNKIAQEIIDARGGYSSLDERLKTIIGGEGAVNVYVSEVEPDLDGIWFDTSDQLDEGDLAEGDPVEGNPLVDEFKKFNNENYLTAKNSYFNTSKRIASINPQCDGFVSNEKIYGKTLQNLFNPNGVKAIYEASENINKPRNIIYEDINTRKEGIHSFINLSSKTIRINFRDTSKTELAWIMSSGAKIQPNSILVMDVLRNYGKMVSCGYLEDGWENTDASRAELEKSLIVLEGDWTEKEVPKEYFSGLKSVESLIEIKATGKNIYKTRKSEMTGTLCNEVDSSRGYIKLQFPDGHTNGVIGHRNDEVFGKMNGIYTVSFNVLQFGSQSGIGTFSVDTNNLTYFYRIDKVGKHSFTIDTHGKDIEFAIYSSIGMDSDGNFWTSNGTGGTGILEIDNLQVVEGSIATEYEPYREEVQRVVTEPLRSVGDIKDEIDIDRGIIVRKLGKVILDGSDDEKWVKSPNYDAFIENTFSRTINLKSWDKDTNPRPSISCDTLPQSFEYGVNEADTFADNHIRIGKANLIQIRKTSDTTIEDFLTWIKANPVTIIYELAEPVEEKINLAPLRLFKEAKQISINGVITPCVEFNLPQNIKAQVDNNTEELERVGGNLVIPANPNILINGDLRAPINQRVQTSYASNGYSIDRWFVKEAKLDVVNGSIMLTNMTEGIRGSMKQPMIPKEFGLYDGEVVTLSLKYKTNSNVKLRLFHSDMEEITVATLPKSSGYRTYSLTVVLPQGMGKSGILDYELLFSDGTEGDSISIQWAKLEIGDKMTPFVPRCRGEELALCQRYFYSAINGVSTDTFNNSIQYQVYLPTSMRIKPTFKQFECWKDLSGQIQNCALNNVEMFDNCLIVNVNVNTDGIGSSHINISEVDSEIY